MSRYLHHYKTESDFKKDYYDESIYKEPWTSYRDRNGRWEPYPVKYNRNMDIVPPIGLWIDDFPDGTDEGYQTPYDPEFVEEKYEYATFDNYLDAYLNNLGGFGSNYWEYIDILEFRDKMYFMYGSTFNGFFGLMPMEYTISELESLSMNNNRSSRFQPFDYIAWDAQGEDIAYTRDQGPTTPGSNFVLVKVDNETDSDV